MTNAAGARRSLSGPVLLLLAALCGLVVITEFASYAFEGDVLALGADVDPASNRPFFTFVVMTALMFGLLGAGLAAVGAALRNQDGSPSPLAAGAGALAGAASAVLVVQPVVLAGIVNRWSDTLEAEFGGVVQILDAFRFAASQSGYALLALAMVLLAIPAFRAGARHFPLAIALALWALLSLAFITDGSDVIPPVVPFAAALTTGAAALFAQLPRRRRVPEPVA